MPVKLKNLSLRDLLSVGLPILLIVALAFWGASRFIKPAPPSRLVISTGGESGAYHRFGALYKDVLAPYRTFKGPDGQEHFLPNHEKHQLDKSGNIHSGPNVKKDDPDRVDLK